MSNERIVKRIKIIKTKNCSLLQFITKRNNLIVRGKKKTGKLILNLETMGKKLDLKSVLPKPNLNYYVGRMDQEVLVISKTEIYQLSPDLSFMEEEQNHQQEAKTIHLTTMQDPAKSDVWQKSEKEPWVDLNIHLENSIKSKELQNSFVVDSVVKLENHKELGHNEDIGNREAGSIENGVGTDLSPKEYLSQISNSMATLKPFSPLLSLSETKSMNLYDRLLALMLNCHAISHFDLMELFKDTNDEKEILEGIAIIAVWLVLIKVFEKINAGIWIVKSENLYTSLPKHARDILLMNLLNDGHVNRSSWTTSTGMEAMTSLNMLQEICSLEGKLWKVKVVEMDIENFAKRYHSVIDKSAEFIKTEGLKAFEAIKAPHKAAHSLSKSKVNAKLIPNAKNLDSLYKLEGDDFNLQFSNLVKSIFQQCGSVLRKDALIRALVTQKPQKECLFKDLDVDNIVAELEKLTIPIRADLLISKEPPDLALLPFRDVLIEMFGRLDKIKKKDVMEQWQEDCDCIPNAGQYTKLMQEFANTKSGGIWILKGLSE